MDLDDIIFLILLALFIPGGPTLYQDMFGIIVLECSNVPAAPPNRPCLRKVLIGQVYPYHSTHILPGKTGLNENFHVHTDVHTYFELMCAICNVDSH